MKVIIPEPASQPSGESAWSHALTIALQLLQGPSRAPSTCPRPLWALLLFLSPESRAGLPIVLSFSFTPSLITAIKKLAFYIFICPSPSEKIIQIFPDGLPRRSIGHWKKHKLLSHPGLGSNPSSTQWILAEHLLCARHCTLCRHRSATWTKSLLLQLTS